MGISNSQLKKISVFPAWNMKMYCPTSFLASPHISKQYKTRVMKYRRFIEMGCTVILTRLYGSHIDNTLRSLFYTHSCRMPRMQRQTYYFWMNHQYLHLRKMFNHPMGKCHVEKSFHHNYYFSNTVSKFRG